MLDTRISPEVIALIDDLVLAAEDMGASGGRSGLPAPENVEYVSERRRLLEQAIRSHLKFTPEPENAEDRIATQRQTKPVSEPDVRPHAD